MAVRMSDRRDIAGKLTDAIAALQLDIDRLADLERRPCDLEEYNGILHSIREAKKEQSFLKTTLTEHRYKWACSDMKDAIKELGDLCREMPDEVRHASVVNRVMAAQEEQRALLLEMHAK
jgi:hypothetical protein